GARLAEEGEQARENHDRQNEIGDWTGGDDRRTRSDSLVVEAARLLFLGHARERLGRRRRGFGVVAEEFHITAERNRRDPPAGSMPVIEAGEFRTEPEREGQNLHTRPAGDQKMAELVEENDDGEDEQKGNRITDEPMAQRVETMKKK